jgi:hypothetical protein
VTVQASLGVADDQHVANVVALVLVVGLAAVPYDFGTGRWSSEWTQTIRGMSLVMFVLDGRTAERAG